MSESRIQFEKAFPIPAHWIEFDEKRNKYYCPYVADAEAYEYQAKWEVWQERQSEIDQLKAEVEKLKNPSLVLHTKKYKEQCEAFESLSDAEKKAYSIGYEWACKVSQQQILTLIQDHESIEDRSDKERDRLKAEKAVLEKRFDSGIDLIESLYKNEFNQRSNADIHISQVREVEKALRGGHE